MIRFLTAGESHGKCLTLIIEGVPSGLSLTTQDIDKDLARRQMGYGRGGRMKIETDKAELTAGVRTGVTLGSPIAVNIQNRDWENWQDVMSSDIESADQNRITRSTVTKPRPGHADLAGGIKYNHSDLRNVLERASARETASRVAAGAIAKRLLDELNIFIISFVIQIGEFLASDLPNLKAHISRESFRDLQENIDKSPVRCPDKEAETCMIKAIDFAKESGDSIGGIFQIVVFNAPIGLGSHVHWDRKLDARLAYAVMSIPAIKGVEIGLGFECARRNGSQVHDEIYYESDVGFYHKTNNAGGLEGGISNGEPIIVKAVMKPIPTLSKPLKSVDFSSKEPFLAAKERSDVCAVPSAGVVGEAMVAIEIANALLEKFGGDTISEIRHNFMTYCEYIANI
jgi:chorismate synthase